MGSLSPEAIHALQMSIQNEKDSILIYQHIRKQLNDGKTANLLNRLIKAENSHTRRVKLKLMENGGEVVVPEDFGLPNRGQLMEMALKNCTLAELINLAIENERIARDFYEAQHQRTENGDVRDIFKWLLEEEVRHVNYLQKEYDFHNEYSRI
jgi:rubrerythrin